MIEELRALDSGQDPPFFRNLVANFLETSRRELAEIAEAIDAGEAERSWRVAHGLKGACQMVGAVRLAESAADLERAGRDDDLEGSGPRLRSLERTYENTARALRNLTER